MAADEFRPVEPLEKGEALRAEEVGASGEHHYGVFEATSDGGAKGPLRGRSFRRHGPIEGVTREEGRGLENGAVLVNLDTNRVVMRAEPNGAEQQHYESADRGHDGLRSRRHADGSEQEFNPEGDRTDHRGRILETKAQMKKSGGP